MSSSFLWRRQVAVLPADRVGLHRVGVYLRLMDKAAFNASQCPVLEPTRAAVMRWTCVRDWHLGPRGHAAARGDRVCVCGSGNDASRGVRPNRRQTLSLSPTGADDRAAIAVACRLGITALWSILLALGDLTLPSTIVAGGTLAGIRHWLRWRWRWHVIASKSKTVIGRAGYVSPRFARGLAPKAEPSEHSGLVQRASRTVVRYPVAK